MIRVCIGIGGLVLASLAAAQPKESSPAKGFAKTEPVAPIKPPALNARSAASQLRSDVETLVKEREAAAKESQSTESDAAAERARLRAQMLDLLRRIESPPRVTPAREVAPMPREVAPTANDTSALLPPIDALRIARERFRAGDFDAALRACKRIDPSRLGSAERVFAQYLTASCLRRTGKRTEAARLYREIADAKEDRFLTQSAQWQLEAIRTTEELEAKLEALRSDGE